MIVRVAELFDQRKNLVPELSRVSSNDVPLPVGDLPMPDYCSIRQKWLTILQYTTDVTHNTAVSDRTGSQYCSIRQKWLTILQYPTTMARIPSLAAE
ncbi:hypothetical protein KIL84_004635 [Mauremys mutica]|uniref:Uncharacterized protein n=1 Tax=Mauremys mutica TaxID=74926 RepID=A0A9D3XPS6_9SAUR|nr:hypothetical protein KIL84_004635 [Mauremys mutica]